MDAPVIELSGTFADEIVAQEAADALNRWFRWILDPSADTCPPVFEPFGVDSGEYAWTLDEDVDWEMGPHARTLGPEVRIAIQTEDTHLRLAGLLRKLGATAVKVAREV